MSMSAQEPTKSESTTIDYTKRAKGFVEKYCHDNFLYNNIPDKGFINWLESLKSSWLPNTWRKNRAAIAYYLEDTLKLYNLAADVRSIDMTGCKKKSDKSHKKQTSSQKKKNFSDIDWSKVLKKAKAKASHTKWAYKTAGFVKATIYTGLRPSEWPDSEYHSPYTFDNGTTAKHVLVVKNSKNTNGRSHGEYRHIILDDMKKEQIHIITFHLEMAKHPTNPAGDEIEYDKYYDGARKFLRSITKNEYPPSKPHPTIYSARHQFCSDLKHAGYSSAEIGALMGHAIGETSKQHYGKKRHGRKTEGLARPYEPEVQKVISRSDMKTNKGPRNE